MKEKWAVSANEEDYWGPFDTADEAIAEGQTTGRTFWVGRCRAPAPPESLFGEHSVDSWLQNEVYEHHDYAGDWAEDAVSTDKEEREDLANQIRPLIAAWLDRHKLRPTHFIIEPESVRMVDGITVKP